MGDKNFNLASENHKELWEEGVFGLDRYEGSHCHTYNPANTSYAGFTGEMYAYLGHAGANYQDDYIQGYTIYIHEKDQFWT